MQLAKPGTERELVRMISEATAAGAPVEVMGAGSKRAIGRPMQTQLTLSTQSLRGVSLYEPTELVMSALAGTPLSRIESELAAMGQMLAFEPLEMGPLLGQPAGQTTIGAVFATNLSGARRISAGAGRDHLLGLKAVSGAGQVFRAGGRVMKNVTGYDMTRLLAGSWGTLAVLSEVTFKVLPAPETTATIVLRGLTDEVGVEALCHALATPYEVSGAIHLHAGHAARLSPDDLVPDGRTLTAVRLEGFERSLKVRAPALAQALAPFAEPQVLDRAHSAPIWDAARQLSFLQGRDTPLWRISTAPTAGPKVVAAIRRYMRAEAYYDWSGGLVWLEVDAAADAGAADIRRVIASHGGHATLIRASPAVRAAVDVFQPLEASVAEISRGIKSVFDPAGILNPGRMSVA